MSKHELRITVSGRPQTLDRPRNFKNSFHPVDTDKNRFNKAIIRMKAEGMAKDEGVNLPIPCNGKGYAIVIFARFKPPKSVTKKRLRAIENGDVNPTCKPDIDNIQKLWLDGLKGILDDDKNVTSIAVQKRFSEQDETECLIMWEEDDAKSIEAVCNP